MLRRLRRPAPWLAALAVAPIDAGVYTLGAAAGRALEAGTARFMTITPFLAGVAAVLLVGAPLRRRLAVPARAWVRDAADADSRSLLERLRTGPGSDWWRREATLAAARPLVWLALSGLALGVLTLGQYLRYADGAPEPSHPALTLLLLGLSVPAALVVTVALDRVAPPGAGPRELLGAALSARSAFARRTLLVGARTAVLGGVVAFAVVVLLPWEFSSPPMLLLSVAVTGMLSALSRAFEFARLDRQSGACRPTRADTSAPVGSAAVVLALLLVSAPVAGTTAIRITDIGYADAGRQALPDDAPGALSAAQANTFQRSYRRLSVQRHADDEGRWRRRTVTGFDRTDRQYWLRVGSGDDALVNFFGEGVTARRDGGMGSLSGSSLNVWTGGNWSAFATTPGAFVFEGHPVETPSSDAPWRVVSANDTALVLGVDGAAVAEATETVPAGDGFVVAENATIRVVIDAERRVLRSTAVNATYFEVENGSRTDRTHLHVVRRYGNVGSHDVARPAPLGPRRAAEWLWDLLYY